ncbi:hypothetical protein [Bosea sp. (in: a-proteobacteria)]|uniref:hypothetical protein n=1 Tax=Bosea sp. (in: a-proteobacteria) TaxID=1871050 RepID=UPI002B471923|nr:hypothetical protein [Bosea sp. (in: a-proteobacteria)]WRH59678.1 MAG: hypothetical protein RSE11_07855 [Bosea sp. (in: a-proteobacteria)]
MTDVYEFNSGLPVRKLSLFDHLGRSPDSSLSRDAITNANKYGLVKGSYAAEQIELTPDGLAVVSEATGPRERAKAKIRLGIDSIDVFKNLYDRLAGVRLPARSALVDSLKEMTVPAELAEEGVDLFLANLRFVGLLQVLAGAERIVTVDHLLDNLPQIGSETAQRNVGPASIPSLAERAVDQAPSVRSLVTQEHANFDTTCFYITPIGGVGSDARKHSDLFLGSIIEPAMMPFGLKVIRADGIDKPGVITRQVIEYILKSRLVIADLSFHNPNVFYELALRHAVRLPVVQIVRHSDNIPFDINQMRTIQIDNSDIYAFVPKIESYKAEIAAQARRALDAGHEVETPISIYFPNLRTMLSES